MCGEVLEQIDGQHDNRDVRTTCTQPHPAGDHHPAPPRPPDTDRDSHDRHVDSGPGDGALFASVHLPSDAAVRGAVVICPPLAKEHISAYRDCANSPKNLPSTDSSLFVSTMRDKEIHPVGRMTR